MDIKRTARGTLAALIIGAGAVNLGGCMELAVEGLGQVIDYSNRPKEAPSIPRTDGVQVENGQVYEGSIINNGSARYKVYQVNRDANSVITSVILEENVGENGQELYNSNHVKTVSTDELKRDYQVNK